MWGLDLKYSKTILFKPENREAMVLNIAELLKQNKFKNIKVSAYLITSEKSTPFMMSFFGGLSVRSYFVFSLNEDGKLTIECSISKGPGTDWGYCKKEVIKISKLINY